MVAVFLFPARAAFTALAMEPSSCFTTELMTACSLERPWGAAGLNKKKCVH